MQSTNINRAACPNICLLTTELLDLLDAVLVGAGLLSHEHIRVWQRDIYTHTHTSIYIYMCMYMYIERDPQKTEKQLLLNDSRLLSFPNANHNTTSETGFCFVSGRIPQTNARIALVLKLDGNWNSLPQGQCIFVQLWTRVHDLGASVRMCAGIKETHSACDGDVCNWGCEIDLVGWLCV